MNIRSSGDRGYSISYVNAQMHHGDVMSSFSMEETTPNATPPQMGW